MKLTTINSLRLSASAIAVVFLLAATASAQRSPPKGKTYGGSMPDSKTVKSGIAWYGVLDDGIAESKRTGKPILFITAAAQCNGVPGMW